MEGLISNCAVCVEVVACLRSHCLGVGQVYACALGKLCVLSLPPSPVCKFGVIIVTAWGVVLTIGLGNQSAVPCIVFGTYMFNRCK